MARANLKKVFTSQLLLPQHQGTYPRGPESASIEIPTFQTQIYFVNKIYYLINNKFEIFMKRGLKGGISIDADSGPLGYLL